MGTTSPATVGEPMTLITSDEAPLEIPTLVELPCGDLLCQTSLTGDRLFARDECGLLRSKDRGRTWIREPHPLACASCPVLFRPGGNKLLFIESMSFLVKGSFPRRFLFRYVESADGGRTFGNVRFGEVEYPLGAVWSLRFMAERYGSSKVWSGEGLSRYAEIFLAAGYDPGNWQEVQVNYLTPLAGASVQLPDGAWLGLRDVMLGWRDDELHRGWNPSGVAGFITRDEGRTWVYNSTCFVIIPTPLERFGYMEPAVIRLDSGLLYCIMRTYSGPISPLVHSWSLDEGETWSAPESLHVAGIAPCLLKLKNGGLTLAFGRPGRWIMFDPTGTGTGWRLRERIDLCQGEMLSMQTNADPRHVRLDLQKCSPPFVSWDMPSMIEVEPNMLLVAYDQQNFVESAGGAARRAIRLVRVDCNG